MTWEDVLGDIAVMTGWTLDEIGDMTPMQVKVVYKGIQRYMGRWVEFASWAIGGKAPKTSTTDATKMLEQRLAQAREHTGRSTFGLLELM